MLASLTKVVKTSATTKKKEEKQQDVFYWSEGSIAVGRVGETNVSSFKKLKLMQLQLEWINLLKIMA